MNAFPATPETARVKDTTAIFGIPRATLYRLAAEGRVRFIKIGRSTLVDCSSVRAFLASQPTASVGNKRAA